MQVRARPVAANRPIEERKTAAFGRRGSLHGASGAAFGRHPPQYVSAMAACGRCSSLPQEPPGRPSAAIRLALSCGVAASAAVLFSTEAHILPSADVCLRVPIKRTAFGRRSLHGGSSAAFGRPASRYPHPLAAFGRCRSLHGGSWAAFGRRATSVGRHEAAFGRRSSLHGGSWAAFGRPASRHPHQLAAFGRQSPLHGGSWAAFGRLSSRARLVSSILCWRLHFSVLSCH